MYQRTVLFLIILTASATIFSADGVMKYAYAAKEQTTCQQASDRNCILKSLEKAASEIKEDNWRDIAYRELAKTLAADGKLAEAQSMINKIKDPDKQALTIRGIGYAAAYRQLDDATYKQLFTDLSTIAQSITHKPSQEIAYTYIAMSQALAGQNTQAHETAAAMTNQALRNKAFGEIAEIVAEKGDVEFAHLSEQKIDSEAYRNKSQRIISKILADKKLYDGALQLANAINNPVLKAEAYQYILNKQKPSDSQTDTIPENKKDD